MRKFATALLACVLATFAATAAAETGVFDGYNAVAMNGDDGHSGLGNAPATATIDAPDLGGGSMDAGVLGAGGGDGSLPARTGNAERATPADTQREPTDATFEPSTPATQTPKRPGYRWQSLVPGAIK